MSAGEALDSQQGEYRRTSNLPGNASIDTAARLYNDDSGFDLDESLLDFQAEQEQPGVTT